MPTSSPRRSIDSRLAYRDRTLRTLPGKLLLGPTGRRLFADYLDKTPGLWGRVDFIHKLNLPGLFTILRDGLPMDMSTAKSVWYPSHLHMAYEGPFYALEEDKFITWDDIAVSCQRWRNPSAQPLTLKLSVCDGFQQQPSPDGSILLTRACASHDLTLTGAVAVTGGLFADGMLTLAPGDEIEFAIVAAIGEKTHDSAHTLAMMARAYLQKGDYLKNQIAEYDAWFDDVPVFSSSDALLDTTWWYRWFILRHNYAEPNLGNFRHGVFYEGRSHKVVKDVYSPWGHEFTQLIPLSTPMHLTDCRWKKEGEWCRQAAWTLLDSMGEDGVFRTMSLDKFSFPFGNYSEWGLYQYYLVHPDKDFLTQILPGLKTNVKGVLESFRNDVDDLQIAYNHRRTGKEYQPAFWYFRGYPDNATDEAGYDWLKRVDLSVYLYLNARGTEHLCRLAGDGEEIWFRDLADRLQKQILSKMWDEETGFFYDLHHQTEAMAKVKGVTGLYPLWAGITNDKHLRTLEPYLDENQFATGSGFASVSRECPVFMPQGSWKGQFYKGRDGCMWDGPSWPYTTAIALDAIARQSKENGHRYDADFSRFLREYAWQHYRNQSLSEPYLVEHYNSVTGEMLSDDVDYNHSYYIDLIVRHVAGIEPTENGFYTAPVDTGLENFSLTNLWLHGHEIQVHYERSRSYRVLVDGRAVYEGCRPEKYTHVF